MKALFVPYFQVEVGLSGDTPGRLRKIFRCGDGAGLVDHVASFVHGITYHCVSGKLLTVMLVMRLQAGDVDLHALEAALLFPIPVESIAPRIAPSTAFPIKGDRIVGVEQHRYTWNP